VRCDSTMWQWHELMDCFFAIINIFWYDIISGVARSKEWTSGSTRLWVQVLGAHQHIFAVIQKRVLAEILTKICLKCVFLKNYKNCHSVEGCAQNSPLASGDCFCFFRNFAIFFTSSSIVFVDGGAGVFLAQGAG